MNDEVTHMANRTSEVTVKAFAKSAVYSRFVKERVASFSGSHMK